MTEINRTPQPDPRGNARSARCEHGTRLWGGGFRDRLDPVIERFCESFSFDRRLLKADVRVNRVWTTALAEAGILSDAESSQIDAALAAIGDSGIGPPGAPVSPVHGSNVEDVHTWVENELGRVVGDDLAGRLRTGRSRNDLVATDLKIWCREEIAATRLQLVICVGALADLAERSGSLAVPGYTHLRRAQPILLAHLMLAHAHRLMRDDDRFADSMNRLDECPLGCGALAGTTVPVDRDVIARRLGFARPTDNSLDTVSDRDFVADALYGSSMVMIHLSQIAEDMILATAEEFGWLELGDAGATGSSLMPQKKNPDALELTRGKSGRVTGRLAGFLTTLKGLPASYNRDLQEDKEALFDAVDTTRGALEAVATMMTHLRPVPERGLTGSAGGLLATDLADYLVAQGVSFAEAHRLAGEAAARARHEGIPLDRLPEGVLKDVSPLFKNNVAEWLTSISSLERRDRRGGTAPDRVTEDLTRVRSWIVTRGGGSKGRS